MPWKPEEPGERPSLGENVVNWIANYVRIHDGNMRGKPFIMADWQAEFTFWLYEIDPTTGKRVNRRGAAILSKGIGKSPWASALSICEFVGPVVFDGWDANGRPVGRPWATPWIQIAATAEDQTDNTWDALYGQLCESDDLLAEYPMLDVGRTRIYMRGNPAAKIEPVTSEAGTREGQRITFAVMDETGLWRRSNGGISLAATLRRNVAKMGGSTLETTNSFVPGEESVAENTYLAVKAMREGRTKMTSGLVYRHRQAPPDTDMSDYESLLAGLKVAYMDTPWIDYDRIIGEIWDPANDPADSRRFYLNQIVSSSDSWISQQEWDLCKGEVEPLKPGDTITLGFDGSVHDDSTALVACRLEDGYLQPIGVWEKPVGALGDNWEVDSEEVDAIVERTFTDYEVVAFFADPPYWQDYIDRWTARYSKKLKVKASQTHPIEFWTNRSTQMVAALERMRTAIRTRALVHLDQSTLSRHVLNAKTKEVPAGTVIRKDFPRSPRKIDAAMAACLAYEARSACVAANLKSRQSRVPIRIR